jgi:hypothetical protein
MPAVMVIAVAADKSLSLRRIARPLVIGNGFD